MTELLQLFSDCSHNFRMTVASGTNRDAGTEIDVSSAFHVPDLGAERTLDIYRGDIAFAACDGIVLARLSVLVGESCNFSDFQFCVTHLSIPPIHMYLISV